MEKSDFEDRQILSQLFEKTFGQPAVGLELMPKAGGDRRYYRFLSPGHRVLGVVADNLREARAYVDLSSVFDGACPDLEGCHVPQVYGYSENFSHYLVEDIGKESLFDLLKNPQIDNTIKDTTVRNVICNLVGMQTVPESRWKAAVAYEHLSERLIMWDLNYFKYEFLKNSDVSLDESGLEDDFERLAEEIVAIPEKQWGFMVRDCQSRNILLKESEKKGDRVPYFIDFQGGRKGPLLYDLVSLMWQAKAGFSFEFRKEMLDYYADMLAAVRGIQACEIKNYYSLLALFRTLQVLGAYGFRGLVQKRAHFIESIPAALGNLQQLLEDGSIKSFPEIEKIAGKLIYESRFSKIGKSQDSGLVVTVFSFSYKSGYPEDLSGNGGGFMFDCRGMHNPGRYDEYKPLTGLDTPVIEFLKSRGEADKFTDRVVELITPSVARYLKRGFSSLQVGFGCTGGRHRSVYCADRTARELARRFPEAEIRLIHREQGLTGVFNSKRK